jgi:hypothetical protein
MPEAKKRSRKEVDDALPLRAAKAVASAKGPGEAPALGSTSVPPVHNRRAVAGAVAAAVAAAAPAVAAAVAAAASSTTAAVAAPVKQSPAVQTKQTSSSSLFDVLRGEFRKRQLEIPTRFMADDMCMHAAMHLAETLYVDQILRETYGNVSLAGKIAKIT